jgi:hypothetical protein
MPLRTFFATVEPGESKCVYTARAGDLEVSIATLPIPGQSQASSGYNFYVGGPELADDGGGGYYVMTSQYSTDVEEDDEIWVAVPKQELAWTAQGVPLTVLVRSKRAGKKSQSAPQ